MSCVLCDGIQDDFLNIRQHYENICKNVILFETDCFKIIPDKFPISQNHIIILPKKHINTFAEFGSKEEEEVGDILNYLQETTKAKNFIMFEHGTSKTQELDTPPEIKSIFHAHLHFIPDVKCNTSDMEYFFASKNVELLNQQGQKENILKYETKYMGKSHLISFFKDNVVYEDKEKTSVESYFYIKNSDGTQLFFPERLVTPQIPSQFLREALSETCNTPEWNWKISMSLEGRKKYALRIKQMVELFEQKKGNTKRICKHRSPNIGAISQNKQRTIGD